MNVFGLKIRGHDTGAALISDGQIAAISEERLNRVKHSFEMFPERSIPYCLEALGVKPEDIDLIVLEQVSARWRVPMKDIFLARMGGRFPKARIEIVNHHDAHAASAFFCSPFEEAAILVYDGAGEVYRTHLGATAIETETLYRGAGNQIHQFQKTLHLRDGKATPYTQGIGKLYSEITYYLGMGKYEEGKTMGLAPYGTDSLLRVSPPEQWIRESGGQLLCNARLSYPPRPLADRIRRRRGLSDFMSVVKSFVRMKAKKKLRPLLFRWGMFQEPDIFAPLRFPQPPRDPEKDDLPDEYYASVAYAAQKVLEEFAYRIGTKLREVTGSENVCVAGGVGLNIDANKNFLDRGGFKRIFIQPAASDAGVPLGAALWGWHVILGQPRFWVMERVNLGRPYTDAEMQAAIKAREGEITVKRSADVAAEAARLVAGGKIIGWFYGGSEYGPRALGHRSILCDARRPEMKDIVNKKVKHREPWRPFAASVLREHQREWFLLEPESPFMLLAAPVVEAKRAAVPSIVHVDGTCRIQSVSREANGRYYDLIAAFYNLTGVPLVLNTSFNLAGEPIVETPADALRCFLNTEMDYLALEDYLIFKKA